MPFDPAARGRFDMMSGGLIWSDEFPRPGSTAWPAVSHKWIYRFLLAYRASVTLGKERAELRPVWEQVARHAPNWPGLRADRRGEEAHRRLRAALRVQKGCLTELKSQLEISGQNITPDGREECS
jgi:hypothetical protein